MFVPIAINIYNCKIVPVVVADSKADTVFCETQEEWKHEKLDKYELW